MESVKPGQHEVKLGEVNRTDNEDDALLSEDEAKDAVSMLQPETVGSSRQAIFWVAVNVVATVLIVFTNKAIFNDGNLKYIQISFAAFHFTVTYIFLRLLSHQGFFPPKDAALGQIIPLSVAMALNVIFPNLSLAYSTVAFYQIARVLVTPCVVALNFWLYRIAMSQLAAVTLIPACVGVAIVSYYDSRPVGDGSVKVTSELGIVFALTGVFFSSLYTIWIAAFRKKLGISSMQLLLNQAPVSAFLLLYFIPWIDTFPNLGEVQTSRWILILVSGALAMLINVSQFFIIAQTGPVASTVVGHSKTCIIVLFGWAFSGRKATDMSVVGLLIALGGIISYSMVVIREKQTAGK